MHGKIDIILYGKELLRVNSKYENVFNKRKNKLIIFLIIGSLITAIICFSWLLTISGNGYYALPLFLSFAWLMLICLSFLKKNTALIITENGVSNYPEIVELWDNISSYEWKEYRGANFLLAPLPFVNCNGLSVVLTTKSYRYKYGLRLDNLIFFNPEQIEMAEQIFTKYGVRKKI